MNKLIFFLKKPKIVMVAGSASSLAQEAINQVLSRHFKVGREILILEKNTEKADFFVKNSALPILAATRVGEYHPEKEFFAGELDAVQETIKLAQALPACGYLILNFDDETVRDIKDKSRAHPLTFGFGARADIRATDVVLTQFPAPGTNFKINYEGNIVPVWLEKLFGKKQIYAALAAAAVGKALGLNLVEISEALKFYQGLPGEMRLIGGIKNSWILDDSENATTLSMLEGLEILKKIELNGRKIAVLGDILGIGKYTAQAHEAMGEKAAKSADLLFTFGARAKFIAQGAQQKGLAVDKIFQYDTVNEGKIPLQDELKEGDLILIDGSKEIRMSELIEEIKA